MEINLTRSCYSRDQCMASTLNRMLLFGWELPQNVVGTLVLVVQAMRGNVIVISFQQERVFVELRSIGAISLGLFVFFTCKDNPFVPVGRENRDHEFGHSFQSRALGPLYLPVIGTASEARVVYAFAYRYVTGRRWSGYYDGFPERQADELGGADLTLRPSP
ncbi:hypothetical protein A1351_21370 [Methylosinus sp. R-45379]|nr:hypothetical protein A1351_21370 [Methylosinus sp. R-45379]